MTCARWLRPALAPCLLWIVVGCSDGDPGPDAGPTVCPMADCTAEGLECGRVTDDLGVCKNCGRCIAPNSCGGAGVANQCGCMPATCESLGTNCGDVVDPCTNTVLSCGACEGADTCGGHGTPNVCGRIVGQGEACDGQHLCSSGLVCCDDSTRCLAACGPQPDLIVDERTLRTTVTISTRTFQPNECSINDGCIPGPGTYRLLRFSTMTANIGDADLVVGSPLNNDDFVFAMCHDHYHYADYLTHRLLDSSGMEVAKSVKAAFCIEDTLKVSTAPETPTTRRFQCRLDVGDGVQGIQAGWGDLYTLARDCQWIDVTDVPPGAYTLELHVNPERRLVESNYLNNVATATVTIP